MLVILFGDIMMLNLIKVKFSGGGKLGSLEGKLPPPQLDETLKSMDQMFDDHYSF